MTHRNGTVLVVLVVSVVFLGLAAASLPVVDQAPRDHDELRESDPVNGTSEPDEEGDPLAMLSVIPLVFLGVLILVGVLSAAYGYRAFRRSPRDTAAAGSPSEGNPDVGTETKTETDSDPESDDPDLDAVAAAAGDAVDRLDDGTQFDNEIYRAWWAMTRALSIRDPNTKTAGEFARAAVRAGMSESHVAELTRLFEDIRYGGRDPGDAEERHATELFSRIRDAYGSPADSGVDENADPDGSRTDDAPDGSNEEAEQ